MPAAAQLLLRQFDFLALAKDLWLARATIVILFVGAVLTAFSVGTWAVTSPGVLLGAALMGADDAYLLLTRSLLALVGGEQHIAVLYSFMGVVENVAFLVGTPLVTWLSNVGHDLRHFGEGLPYFILAVFFAIGVGILMTIQPTTPENVTVVDDEA